MTGPLEGTRCDLDDGVTTCTPSAEVKTARRRVAACLASDLRGHTKTILACGLIRNARLHTEVKTHVSARHESVRETHDVPDGELE